MAYPTREQVEDTISAVLIAHETSLVAGGNSFDAFPRMVDAVMELFAVPGAVAGEPEPEWRCGRCGSDRWVAASLGGPLSQGGRAICQCVPCGRYSDDPVPERVAGEPESTPAPEQGYPRYLCPGCRTGAHAGAPAAEEAP